MTVNLVKKILKDIIEELEKDNPSDNYAQGLRNGSIMARKHTLTMLEEIRGDDEN